MTFARFYVALALLATPAAALAADLKALLVGDMAQMVLHDEPRAAVDIVLIDPDGAEATVQDMPGALRVVNVWATWCPPCLKEMPSIGRLAKAVADDGVAVIPVSTDRGDPAKPQAFLDGLKTGLTTWRDPKFRFGAASGLLGQPTTLILDAQGREIARFMGDAEWDAPEAVTLIRAMAAAQ